ncbi:MAG: D-alanyl-D-alanine carboxypeptidase/D-alanyl-D-alanine-endopeptidase [Bacteroidaceae bacterium]|nr:D-alanyl-D-alanine carboxypeptidase/D-alanyl-D-alanine-endopeptidase [Bacteroidaceae bacterium]
MRRGLLIVCALALLAGCKTRTVIRERVVTVHDTVRVAVAAPVKAYSADWTGRTQSALDSLCGLALLGETQVGMCVFDLTAGTVVFERGLRQRMRPASTMKVITAVTAMTAVMGHPDCFALRCWVDMNDVERTGKTLAVKPSKTPNLILAGGMDPLLAYADLCALADTLAGQGIREVKDIRLDVSLADTTRWGEGWCWDDANEAMTPFSYNGSGAARGGRGSSRLAWRQQPEVPFVADLRKAFASRKIRVTGTIRRNLERTAPRTIIDAEAAIAAAPAGRSAAASGSAGSNPAVSSSADSRFAAVPAVGEMRDGMRLVARIGHRWEDVLVPMMKNSDNLYAEAMLHQLGLLAPGARPSLATIDDAFEALCSRLGLSAYNYRIADGSGRSLYNYATPELLCRLLNHAATQPWFALFRSSLPVMGVDGTLRKRCKGTTAEGNVQAKTGSLYAVSSLAGYTTSAEGHLLCFAIINQGLREGAMGRAFQDEVCKILTRATD